MNDLFTLSTQIKSLRKNGKLHIPISLQKEILKTIESKHIPMDQAADVLGLHQMTFYKWRRKLNKKVVPCEFTVLPSTPTIPPIIPALSTPVPFLEIDLGSGCMLRIFK